MRFIDLFAGLGGFHVALSSLGHEAVFACELDRDLRTLYECNFGLAPAADIRSVNAEDVPAHDICCAGFPCQPFSLAGKKSGAACPSSGKLIDDVFRIVAHHLPRFVLLENVPNVLTIEDGAFWDSIRSRFLRYGYEVQYRIYSPLQFGIPQQRQRLFVVASRQRLDGFSWPEPAALGTMRPLWDFLIEKPDGQRDVEPAKIEVLEHWNILLKHQHAFCSEQLLASEFGATYPIGGLPKRGWKSFCGGFGSSLASCRDRTEAIRSLPHYAATRLDGSVPTWMLPAVHYSRMVYSRDPAFYDKWKRTASGWHNSWQKLEWRGDREHPDLWHHTLQFRASGIRVMKPELAPSLIAMSPTQTPIIGPRKRYMAVREAAALQALEEIPSFPSSTAKAFKALGNAVNAKIVATIVRAVSAGGDQGHVRSQRGARHGDVHGPAQSGI